MSLRNRIEFVTHEPRVAEMFPPVPARKALPAWFRHMSPLLTQRRFPRILTITDSTMKGCPGVNDYLNLGYIVPFWTDFLVTADATGFGYEAGWVGNQDPIMSFPPTQWAGCPRREGTHDYLLKIVSPWQMRTPRGWSVLLLPAAYESEERFTVQPGVVDADRLGTLTLIAAWHVPRGETALLRAGDPFMHVVPFRRSSLSLSVKSDSTLHQWISGRGIGAVGRRIAAGAYRDNARVCSRKT